MSIRERLGEIKGFFTTIGSEWVVISIVIVVGLGGFALGRLSGLQSGQAVAQTASVSEPLGIPERIDGGRLVASRNGTKYHFPWCAGAQQISEANKIWFESAEEARRAGYTPAGNCKGLE